ncbi:MAG TPA: ATP-binding protein, partial [Thermoanaerobaculia bacterium]|nr:ATP-binding protein [Thermoanaerobaculia bacterium]
FTYWRGRKSLEVDILAEVNLRLIPFEVKYSRSPVLESDLKGLRLLCAEKEIPRGYVITRQISDFGVVTFPGKVEASILKIPAPLACYWLSRSEGRS